MCEKRPGNARCVTENACDLKRTVPSVSRHPSLPFQSLLQLLKLSSGSMPSEGPVSFSRLILRDEGTSVPSAPGVDVSVPSSLCANM